mmetsp:Transcript_92468/g.205391  ORF Transcript_92468/g.205391 Transcript_92468/m.205391 type:complete len:390 (+) Transcript_92468:1120-2289(+)
MELPDLNQVVAPNLLGLHHLPLRDRLRAGGCNIISPARDVREGHVVQVDAQRAFCILDEAHGVLRLPLEPTSTVEDEATHRQGLVPYDDHALVREPGPLPGPQCEAPVLREAGVPTHEVGNGALARGAKGVRCRLSWLEQDGAHAVGVVAVHKLGGAPPKIALHGVVVPDLDNPVSPGLLGSLDRKLGDVLRLLRLPTTPLLGVVREGGVEEVEAKASFFVANVAEGVLGLDATSRPAGEDVGALHPSLVLLEDEAGIMEMHLLPRVEGESGVLWEGLVTNEVGDGPRTCGAEGLLRSLSGLEEDRANIVGVHAVDKHPGSLKVVPPPLVVVPDLDDAVAPSLLRSLDLLLSDGHVPGLIAAVGEGSGEEVEVEAQPAPRSPEIAHAVL